MLGNDVVDLRDPETQTRHPGFDARVFRAEERRVIEASKDAHAMRQMLWAAKESAYKAARRDDPATVFSPVRFEVDLDDAGRGEVRHGRARFQVRVMRDGDCIHAVASRGVDPEAARTGVARTEGADPSLRARSLALADLADQLGVPAPDLHIERRQRIPELHLRGAPRSTLLTLSHHGRYAAFAALNPT